MQRFYKRRAHQPAWVGSEHAGLLAAELAKAPSEGLDPRHYDLADSVAVADRKAARGFLRSGKQDYPRQSEAELRLSYVFLRYARHLATGSVDPRALDKNWVGETRSPELPDVLEKALQGGSLGATLEGLRPRHPQYARLQQALARHRGVPAAAGSGARLPGGGQLRNAAAGATAGGGDDSQRIRTLELNLERWRWLPEDLGTRFVMVNIPAFRLQAFEGGAAHVGNARDHRHHGRPDAHPHRPDDPRHLQPVLEHPPDDRARGVDAEARPGPQLPGGARRGGGEGRRGRGSEPSTGTTATCGCASARARATPWAS